MVTIAHLSGVSIGAGIRSVETVVANAPPPTIKGSCPSKAR